MNIRIHDQAAADLQTAYGWYSSNSAAASRRFLQAVDEAIDALRHAPEMRAVLLGRFRRIKLKHFPFVIVYEILSADTLKIVAIAHTSRRPGYWKDRA